MAQQIRWNLLLQTDSYKLTHFRQYPLGSRHVYSYLESRGGMFSETVMAGLQAILKMYLTGEAFKKEDVEEARAEAHAHFGNDYCFHYAGWMRLLEKHGGRLPLRIKAVAEGTVVPGHNALVTVENTDPEFPWLTNWVETMLLQVWYPITVATLSRAIKIKIGEALLRTGDINGLPFKLHDFGYRGVSSQETAAMGGAAHLFNFRGTDTLAAIRLLRQYYGATEMPGFSIPASEHSTITSWGEDREGDAYENMLDQYPDGLVACVSDSYNIYKAVRDLWGGRLRDKIMSRNGTLVVRPDSGDPVVVLDEVFNILAERFGCEVNNKGWKVLPSCVRVIQGDGVNYHTIQNMISQLTRKGWSMDNWAFVMGGALLQQLNRDTLRFAFKCSAININGEWRDVYKHPITDPTKDSKRGRFVLLEDTHHSFVTMVQNEGVMQTGDCLETVFEDGELKVDYTLQQIRERVDRYTAISS